MDAFFKIWDLLIRQAIGKTEKGIFLAIASCACYASAALLIKTAALSSPLIVFSRNLIGLLVFLPFFLWKKEQLKTKKLGSHFFRACISLAAIYFSTYGIQHLNLGDAILLEQSAPFFILAILFVWKREKISFLNLVAMSVAFVGVISIIAPHFSIFHIGSLASIASGFLIALSFIAIESLVKTQTPLATLFYFLFFSTCLSIVPALGRWSEIVSLQQGLLLLLIGVFFALSQLLRGKALTLVSVNVVGGYSYFATLFSVLLGSVFLNEKFTYIRMLGSALIIGSGVYIFYEKRNAQRKNEGAKCEGVD